MAQFFSRLSGGVFRKNLLPFSLMLLVGAALLTVGCHPAVKDPNDPKFIVAEGPGWKITREELNTEMNGFLKQRQLTPAQVGPAKMPILESQMLESMVLKELLLAKAAKMDLKGVDKEEASTLQALKDRIPPGQDFEAQLKTAGITMDELKKRIHEEILINKVLEAEAFKNADPSEEEITAFYNEHKDQPPITSPEKFRASRVLIKVDESTSPADKAKKKKQIDAALAQVKKGEDFSKVATAVSEDRYSAPKGGDIGYFQRGENEAQFDEVVFNLKQGTVSGVFETPLGFQFVKVTEIKPAGLLTVADVRPAITSYLKKIKQQKLEMDYTKKLLDDNSVTFHIKRIDPAAAAAAAAAAGGAPEGAPTAPAPAADAPAPAPQGASPQ